MIMNENILTEIKNQDYQSITERIQNSIIQKCSEYDKDGVIFGLSGGIDSAVIAHMCAKSIKEKVLALIMPDSKISPKDETEDAIKIVDTLGINYKLIDINSIHKEYHSIIEPEDLALGNLRARIRKNLIYYYANSKNLLVLGSSDKSEIARYLGVSDNIIKKKSSPNLWPNHIAESEIGATYEEIDSILYCLIDKKISLSETVNKTQINDKTVEKIYQLYKKSKHKRITPEHL